MTKLKAPLLSLEAHNSLAGTLTYQRRQRTNFVRRKPSPGNVVTLPRQYQRWLYEDYVDWWNEQTPAVKRQYEVLGAPLHLTGYQYWMREHLRDLPDIALDWHLDAIIAGQTLDSSRNANTGTVFGCTVQPGLIANAFFFDHLDDRVTRTLTPSLQLIPPRSAELYVYPQFSDTQVLVNNAISSVVAGFAVRLDPAVKLRVTAWWNYNNLYINPNWDGIDLNTWSHIYTSDDGVNCTLWVNGILRYSYFRILPYTTNWGTFWLGQRHTSGLYPFGGLIDGFRLLSRIYSQTTIKKHAERRFSP